MFRHDSREEDLKRREQALSQSIATSGGSKKNWPRCCPLVYHSIGDQIPEDSRRLVYQCYLSYLIFVVLGGFAAVLCPCSALETRRRSRRRQDNTPLPFCPLPLCRGLAVVLHHLRLHRLWQEQHGGLVPRHYLSSGRRPSWLLPMVSQTPGRRQAKHARCHRDGRFAAAGGTRHGAALGPLPS